MFSFHCTSLIISASKYDELPEDHILEQFSILCRKLQVQKDIRERCLIAVQNMILDTFSGLSWWEKTSRKHAAKYFSPDYCPGLITLAIEG